MANILSVILMFNSCAHRTDRVERENESMEDVQNVIGVTMDRFTTTPECIRTADGSYDNYDSDSEATPDCVRHGLIPFICASIVPT